jgi:hypothetical protein
MAGLPAWSWKPMPVAARMKAALAGLDVGLDFASDHELDGASSQQIPEHMIGRLLDDGVSAACSVP